MTHETVMRLRGELFPLYVEYGPTERRRIYPLLVPNDIYALDALSYVTVRAGDGRLVYPIPTTSVEMSRERTASAESPGKAQPSVR